MNTIKVHISGTLTLSIVDREEEEDRIIIVGSDFDIGTLTGTKDQNRLKS